MEKQVFDRIVASRWNNKPSSFLFLIIAFLSAFAGLYIATQYPIAPAFLVSFLLISAATCYFRPDVSMFFLPALLPIIGMAPWTGWISFEEIDLLILAAAAGTYASLVFRKNVDPIKRNLQRTSSRAYFVWLLIILFVISLLVSMQRGFEDAGGASFGWFQGYHEPMNSFRIAKSFFLALLILPLWQKNFKQDSANAANYLTLGAMFGLVGAVFATIWERMAFTDLLNFSADYRTTGLFWEMHVGGAALDGFLTLMLPFALHELVNAKTKIRWLSAAIVLGMAAYSCLTTFSRGVYLAVIVSMIAYLFLHFRQQKKLYLALESEGGLTQDRKKMHLLSALLLVISYSIGASILFPTSGYRGAVALLSAMLLMLPLANEITKFKRQQWILSLVFSTVFISISCAVSWLIPKGSYVAWIVSTLFTASMLLLSRGASRQLSGAQFSGVFCMAGFVSTVTSSALVASHWGGQAALISIVPVLFGVMLMLLINVVTSVSQRPLWPVDIRWQATTAGIMAVALVGIGILGGGAYMTDRFSTGKQDFSGRQAHWKMGLEMLSSPSDWVFGKGIGRFPSNYSLIGKTQEHTGDYRIKHDEKNTYLTIAGGLHVLGGGEMLRVSQRIAPAGSDPIVAIRVRAQNDVTLHFGICQKHLLYEQTCSSKNLDIKGMNGVWQPLQIELKGSVDRGEWYAPKLLVFSIAMATRGGVADVDDVVLNNSRGEQLIKNGDFSKDMENWFFSSDRHHLPWHIKNIFMNIMFDQGLFGVTVFSSLLILGLWRVSIGRLQGHSLAPALAASLIGFIVVGLFDSLLDVPRLGWIFYMLLLLSLTMTNRRQSSP